MRWERKRTWAGDFLAVMRPSSYFVNIGPMPWVSPLIYAARRRLTLPSLEALEPGEPCVSRPCGRTTYSTRIDW